MRSLNVLTMILAGGVGQRLFPLTANRCKPAVPFGGNFRIVDFTLMNCVLSGCRQIHILTQYHAQSLNRHRVERWNCLSSELGEYIHLVPPKLNGAHGVYRSTADAVFRNLDIIESSRPDVVLILSGDHVYRADYRKLIEAHLDRDADVTVLTGEVDVNDASAFGCVQLSPQGRITSFVEKPKDPSPYALDGKCLINLGVYCFQTRYLAKALREDARLQDSTHDFGKDILPRALRRGFVSSCGLEVVTPDGSSYWRDVGSIDSYFQANMDLLARTPLFDLRDTRWASCSRFHEWVPSRHTVTATIGGRKMQGSNLIGTGVHIDNAQIVNSVLSNRAEVGTGSELEQCILFPGARVGRGAKLRRVIVEQGVEIPDETVIGFDKTDIAGHVISPNGVVVVAPPETVVTESPIEAKAEDFDAVGNGAEPRLNVAELTS